MTIADQKLELLSAYVDGELSAAEQSRVESWLADDADLRRAHRQMIALGERIRALPGPRLSDNFTDQVMQRLAAVSEAAAQTPTSGGLSTPIAPAAVVADAPSANVGGAFPSAPWTRWAAVAITIAAATLLAIVFAPTRATGPASPKPMAASDTRPAPLRHESTEMVQEGDGLDLQGPGPVGMQFMSLFDVIMTESAYKRGVLDQVLNQAGIQIEKGLTVDEQMEQAIFTNRLMGRLEPTNRDAQPANQDDVEQLATLQLLYVVAGGRQFDQVYHGLQQRPAFEVRGVRMDLALAAEDKLLFERLDRAHDLMIAQSGNKRVLGVARRILLSMAMENRLTRQLAYLAAPAALGLVEAGGQAPAAADQDAANPELAAPLGDMEAMEFHLVIVLRVIPDPK